MIKEVGTLGVFVKFNSTTASGKLLDIFSSLVRFYLIGKDMILFNR